MRRAEDHRGDPGSAGDREDPHPPGSAGAGTPACAGLLARRCKRLDDSDSPLFERPNTQGRWSRLRAGGYGTDGCGQTRRDNPRTVPENDAFRLDRLSGPRPTHLSRHPKTGSRRFGRCVPSLCSGVLGVRRTGKWAFEIPILPPSVCATSNLSGAPAAGATPVGRVLSQPSRPPSPVTLTAPAPAGRDGQTAARLRLPTASRRSTRTNQQRLPNPQ